MPQMSPMFWLALMLFFVGFYLFLLILIYFSVLVEFTNEFCLSNLKKFLLFL